MVHLFINRVHLFNIDPERIDKRLHKTKLLLQNYRMFLVSSGCNAHKSDDFHKELHETILDNMISGTLDNDEIYIESIKSSSLRAAIIVKHIEDMVSMYEIFCEKSGSEEERRRYRILKMLYIDDPGVNVGDIAEIENMAVRTVYKDLDKAIRKLSSLFFGIDGMNFDINSFKRRNK